MKESEECLPNLGTRMCTNMQVILCRGLSRDLSSTFLAFCRPVGVRRAIFTVRNDRHEYFMKNENVVAVRRTYDNRMGGAFPGKLVGQKVVRPKMSDCQVKINSILNQYLSAEISGVATDFRVGGPETQSQT